MILHIHPTWNNEYVTLTEEACEFALTPICAMQPLHRSREMVFGSLDLLRQMYDDIIIHLDPR